MKKIFCLFTVKGSGSHAKLKLALIKETSVGSVVEKNHILFDKCCLLSETSLRTTLILYMRDIIKQQIQDNVEIVPKQHHYVSSRTGRLTELSKTEKRDLTSFEVKFIEEISQRVNRLIPVSA